MTRQPLLALHQGRVMHTVSNVGSRKQESRLGIADFMGVVSEFQIRDLQ